MPFTSNGGNYEKDHFDIFIVEYVCDGFDHSERYDGSVSNITFKRCRYRFGGKLTNNTHIAGQIESMWVWYKRLSDLG